MTNNSIELQEKSATNGYNVKGDSGEVGKGIHSTVK